MLISFSWLKKYVHLPDSISAKEVAEKLKLSTVEVEGIETRGADLDNIVVGQIKSIEKHPQADKLQVCVVDLGAETVRIVCGGSNLRVDMKVVVAKVGARVKWHGEGELVELKPATIRGVASEGMICGADEVGLIELFPKKEEREVVDLGAMNAVPGTLVAEALGLNDVVFEIDNKSLSHRPDLWGHYGLAREVAVLTNREVKPYSTTPIKPGKEHTLHVEVAEKNLCSRYMAVIIEGVVITESPEWLKRALVAAGHNPINVVVDITNYILSDLGQPMHAFDARFVRGAGKEEKNFRLGVRAAKEDETIETLDGVTRALDQSMLVVANDEKALAIAGVMGGKESAIQPDTTAIIFESAHFNAASVRRTGAELGLRTESSMRFEKNLDPTLCAEALARAVELMLELCPGARVTSAVVDHYPVKARPHIIEMPLDFFEKKIGAAIEQKKVVKILSQLGFVVEEKRKSFKITVPSWRATKDVCLPEDVVEEVVRVYGYAEIPATMPSFPLAPPDISVLRKIERIFVDLAVREGRCAEVYNYSFVSGQQIEKLGDDLIRSIRLDNPLSEDKPYLRRSLLPNLLENSARNLPDRDEVFLVETGKVFKAEESGPRTEWKSDELLPRQDTYGMCVMAAKKEDHPFSLVRRLAERMSTITGYVFHYQIPKENASWQHPGRMAEIWCENVCVGSLFELHPKVGEMYGVPARVGVCELNLTLLSEAPLSLASRYQPQSNYPDIVRDVAFVVPKNVTHEQMIGVILAADPLLVNVELFDTYEGLSIGVNKKSVAFHLTFQHRERTLTAAEVDKVEEHIKTLLRNSFAAEVRAA